MKWRINIYFEQLNNSNNLNIWISLVYAIDINRCVFSHSILNNLCLFIFTNQLSFINKESRSKQDSLWRNNIFSIINQPPYIIHLCNKQCFFFFFWFIRDCMRLVTLYVRNNLITSNDYDEPTTIFLIVAVPLRWSSCFWIFLNEHIFVMECFDFLLEWCMSDSCDIARKF